MSTRRRELTSGGAARCDPAGADGELRKRRSQRQCAPDLEIGRAGHRHDLARPIQLTLKAKDLAYWDAQRKQWVVEDDKVDLMLGSSSADVKARQTISVNGAGS